MPNFAVRLVHGASWNADAGIRDQAGWTEHAALMDGLVATGFIVVGGPVGDGQQTLHVVEADDEAALRRRFAEDPWAHADLLRVGSVERWHLWLDFRKGTPVS